MISKEDKEKDIHCKKRGVDCQECPDSQRCEESTDKIVLDEFTEKLYKNITREQIIMAFGHAQASNVLHSNQAYNLKKQRDKLVEFLELEIGLTETSAENQSNEYFKNLFLGQKVAYERVLREITHLKFIKGE